MRVRRPVVIATAGAAAGAALVAGVLTLTAVSSSPQPSAQCRSQLRQVAVLQADARNIQASSVAVANGQLIRFRLDVGTAGRLLKIMKSEGCPDGGY